jgi:outer membrane PBP1 activator LpoA protein
MVLVILTMTACEVTGPVSAPPVPDDTSTAPPDLLLRAASAPPSEAARLYLDAARGFLALADLDQTAAALAQVDSSLLTGEAQFDYYSTSTRLALDQGDAPAAEAALSAALPQDAQQQQTWQLLTAEVLGATGRFSDAAESIMAIPMPAEADQAQAQSDLTWRFVRSTPGFIIIQRADDASAAVAAGWWQLAAAMERSFDVAAQRQALATWQQRHRDHPAFIWPPTQLARLSASLATPERIGLFLPLSGPLAAAGQAVRDGFLAAFYHVQSPQTVRLYDTNGADVTALYEQAMADRIDVIVGPLDKSSVSALNSMPFRQVPVIALNELPSHEEPGQGLVQFSLAIEDEASNVADRVAADQVGRVAIIHSFADWSGRAEQAFSNRWMADGGARPLVGDFIDVKNITSTVGEVLQVDASTERAADLARTIGQAPEFMPRRRRDLDALVAFVDNVQARALKPALAFHFARDLPVYAVSQSVQPITPSNLRDLDGLRVCLIPWLLIDDPLKGTVVHAFDGADGLLAPFYAFGVDAYRLADRLTLIGEDPDARISGATGVLRLTADGRVQRDLTWAVVRDGTLHVLPRVVEPPRS